MKIIKYIPIILIFTGLFSCDMLEPIDENRLSIDYIETDPASAEGLLLQAYNRLINQYQFTEAATDDAVNNQLDNGYNRMATGELSSEYNPTSKWGEYERVLYVNKFIEIVSKGTVAWHRDSVTNKLFDKRLMGEALALRGLFHFYILQAHAGFSTSGDLLGIPYYKTFIPANGDFKVPRLSFQASVQAIMDDFDAAIKLLPTVYSNNKADVDPNYADVDFAAYQTVNGPQYNLRISGRIVKGLKARLALFAASPSFLNGAGYYEKAANSAAELLNSIGGVAGLAQDGVEFYTSDVSINSTEFLWRGSLQNISSSVEESHFPPSRNGKGQINPTQNLVNAFPMKNGFPATVANGYNPQNPYVNRDPRLTKYIVTNGASFGGGTIKTGFGGGVDRVDSIPEQSTRTGYYLQKLLRPDVRLNNDGTTSGKKHFNVYFRYTELFLILAEAANEIGGPTYKVNGISAYDVIAAIRKRAGISQPDSYLASIASKEQMRELIRNERRLELCFEGHRFWDIRRWGLPLNENAKGYFNTGTEYVELPAVEIRDYPSYANYLPIPYREVLKFGLVQNRGW